MRLTAPAWQPLRHNAVQPAALIVGRTQITKTLPIGGVFFMADGAGVVVMP